MFKRQKYLHAVYGSVLLILMLSITTACFTIFPTPTPTPTPTKQATVIPEIVYSTIQPPAQPLICPGEQSQTQNSFVTNKGIQLRYQGTPLKLYGYTFYPAVIGGTAAWHKPDFTRYIDHILDMGEAVGQNLVRPTDFWNEHDADKKQNNVTVWHNMDYLICAAKQHGMFVVMDISAFAHWLASQHHEAYDVRNWIAFVRAVGKRYANQSSIAFYSILGEPMPPKTQEEMNHLVDFYRTITDELARADAGHHLITAGGFNHMEDESAALPWWHTIYQLPHNDIVAFKTYSQNDLQLLPTIATFAKSIAKPAIDEEFGLPQSMGDMAYTGQAYNGITSGRAQFYQHVYSEGEQNAVTGFIFWNIGCGIAGNYYEVNPDTPAVWNVIQAHAPRKSRLTLSAQQICPLNN